MIPSDQRPPGQDYLTRRIADLERKVRELEAGKRLEAATIGQGGLTVKGGGQVVIKEDSGHIIIQLGQVPLSDGTSQPGMVAWRSDANGGTAAMSLYDGVLAVWDRGGHIVMSTDEVSGEGLARPWLPVPFTSADYTTWGGTTSSTFQQIGEATISRQQPKFYAVLLHTTDATDTTGQLRLMCNGVQIGQTVDVGFVITNASIGPLALPAGEFSETLTFSLEGRRTAGTGKVRAAVSGAWTRQT